MDKTTLVAGYLHSLHNRMSRSGTINCFFLFQMRSTGIPELTCVEDVDYISHSLVYNKSDIEAESDFQQLIQKCIDLGWTVQIMWWIHIRKKGGNSSWKYPSTLLFDFIIIVCIFHSDISISFTSVVFLSSSWTNSNSRDEIKLAF